MLEVPVAEARKLLAAPAGEIAELWVRPFADDGAAHDAAQQARLKLELTAAFDAARSDLAAAFGPPARVSEADDEAVPLSGVSRVAV